MSGFLEACMKYFGTENLYEILSVEKTATPEDIKKAYRRVSLKIHPDRVDDNEKEEATEKFKIISKIHATLSDEDKRGVYDETGCVDDDDSLKDWAEYWRITFKKITDDDIKNYEANYKGGDEEKTDLIKAYQKFDGDIDMILDHVPFSHPEDIPRFQDIVRPMIENGELPSHHCFFNDSPKKQAARKRKYDLEARQVEKENSRKKKQNEKMDVEASALNAIILRKKEREAEADAFFAHLEAKYAKPAKKSKSRRK